MDPLSRSADEKRDYEQHPDHGFLRVAANLAEAEDIAERGDQNEREKDTAKLAATAKYAHAPEQGDGNDVEFEADGVIGAGVGEPCGEDDTGDGADQSTDHEQAEADSVDLDACISGGFGIAADRVYASAERSALQDDDENRREQEKRHERPRHGGLANRIDAEVGERVRKFVHRARAEDDVPNSPVHGHCTQRDYQ